MFKCQLQELCQKAGLGNPIYNVTKKEGPAHEPQFQASVIVQGVVYESPTTYGSLKAAKHAAAEVALQKIGKSNSVHVGSLHESGLCKNLLQEYAQKRGMNVPLYKIVKTGGDHAPLFAASVEVGGVHYKGENCKSKKQAEIKAARAALVTIYAASGAALQGTPKQNPEEPVKEETSFDIEPHKVEEPTVDESAPPVTCVTMESTAQLAPSAACVKMEATPPESLSGAKRKRELQGDNVGQNGKEDKGETGKNKEPVGKHETGGMEESGSLLMGCDGIPGITTPATKGEEQHAQD